MTRHRGVSSVIDATRRQSEQPRDASGRFRTCRFTCRFIEQEEHDAHLGPNRSSGAIPRPVKARPVLPESCTHSSLKQAPNDLCYRILRLCSYAQCSCPTYTRATSLRYLDCNKVLTQTDVEYHWKPCLSHLIPGFAT